MINVMLCKSDSTYLTTSQVFKERGYAYDIARVTLDTIYKHVTGLTAHKWSLISTPSTMSPPFKWFSAQQPLQIYTQILMFKK